MMSYAEHVERAMADIKVVSKHLIGRIKKNYKRNMIVEDPQAKN
jgi:hypothetical protein